MIKDPILFSKPTIMEHEIKETLNLLISDSLNSGRVGELFKQSFYRDYPFQALLTLSSYDVAFLLSLHTLGLKPGGTIALPAYGAQKQGFMLESLGYIPLYIDVQVQSGVIDTNLVENLIAKKQVEAIFITFPFFYDDSIKTLLQQNVPLIIDYSSVLGVFSDKDLLSPSFPMIGLVSHHENEIITTGGKGCSLFTSYEPWVNKLSQISVDLTITDLQAALGQVQYSKINNLIESRKNIANQYSEIVEEYALVKKCNYHQWNGLYYPIWLNNIDMSMMLQIFNNSGVELQQRYPNADMKDHAHSYLLESQTICLPIYPTLSKTEVQQIKSLLSHIF